MKHVSTDQLASLTADPASPADGGLWYRSDTDVLNVRLDGATRIATVPYVAVSSSTTAIGTSATAVNNLSVVLPAGTWAFTAWIPGVSVGTLTNLTATLSPASGPTLSWLRGQVTIWQSTTVGASALVTAFNTTSGGAAFSNAPVAVYIQGAMLTSTSGTLSISLTRTSGTSFTTSVGSYLSAIRLA